GRPVLTGTRARTHAGRRTRAPDSDEADSASEGLSGDRGAGAPSSSRAGGRADDGPRSDLGAGTGPRKGFRTFARAGRPCRRLAGGRRGGTRARGGPLAAGGSRAARNVSQSLGRLFPRDPGRRDRRSGPSRGP